MIDIWFCSCDCVEQPCHSATGQKKRGNPKERVLFHVFSKFHISHVFCLNSSRRGHCELVETLAAGLHFQRIAAIWVKSDH